MADVRATDMSRYWRIFTVESGLVRGDFAAFLGPRGTDEITVCPFDVTIYFDPDHVAGRCLTSKTAFTAFIEGNDVTMPDYMIDSRFRADIEEASDDMHAAILAVALAAREAMSGGEGDD